MAEQTQGSIRDRIAALNLDKIQHAAPNARPASPFEQAPVTLKKRPLPPPPRYQVPQRQQTVNNPPIYSNAPTSSRRLGNQPNDEAPPPPRLSPPLPPRPPPRSIAQQSPALPARSSPALPLRKASAHSMRTCDSNESISTIASGVSAYSLGSTVSNRDQLYTNRAPTYNPSKLPPLPPKTKTTEAPKKDSATLRAMRSRSSDYPYIRLLPPVLPSRPTAPVEPLFVKSNASIDFERQLHDLFIPRALHTKPSGDLEQINHRSENTVETYEASAKLMHEGLVNDRDLSTGSEENSEEVKGGSKSSYYMKWRTTSSGLLLRLKRATRPRVRVGYDRVEWLCACGQHLYRDFEKSNIFAGHYSCQHISGSTNTPPIQSATPLNAGMVLPGSQNIAMPTAHMGISNNPGNSCSQNNHQIQTIENLSQPGIKRRRFFEVCVNTGGYTITLGEIDVTDVQSDQELFSKIVEKYYNLRTPRFRRMLMKPVDVHFVFFSLRKSYRVSIRDRPIALPPKEEIDKQRYEYNCRYPPPMDRYEFLHYFYKFSNGHPDAEYFERFPKRLNLPICNPQSQDDHGWGIHIIEGPNRVLLTWLCVSALIVSFIVSVIYAVVMKTQEQGFGIGSWMVAVLTTSLAAVYFQFEES